MKAPISNNGMNRLRDRSAGVMLRDRMTRSTGQMRKEAGPRKEKVCGLDGHAETMRVAGCRAGMERETSRVIPTRGGVDSEASQENRRVEETAVLYEAWGGGGPTG